MKETRDKRRKANLVACYLLLVVSFILSGCGAFLKEYEPRPVIPSEEAP